MSAAIEKSFSNDDRAQNKISTYTATQREKSALKNLCYSALSQTRVAA
jgi:hypothetical protein